MDTQSHPGRRGLLHPSVPIGRPTRQRPLPCPPHRPQLPEIHESMGEQMMHILDLLGQNLQSCFHGCFLIHSMLTRKHSTVWGACKTPGNQGGVGRHVQCLPNTLSETDHGHHHENCTCTCAEVETADFQIPNQTACGHRLLQKRHQERRQRDELGHQMGDVAV